MNKKLLLIAAVTLALMVSLIGPAPVAASPPEMVKVLIGFDRQPSSDEVAIVRGAGGAIKHTYHLVPAIAASIPEPAIQGLLRNPRVTSIESDITVYAIDAELDNAWGVKHIGAGIVHDGGNKGTGGANQPSHDLPSTSRVKPDNGTERFLDAPPSGGDTNR